MTPCDNRHNRTQVEVHIGCPHRGGAGSLLFFSVLQRPRASPAGTCEVFLAKQMAGINTSPLRPPILHRAHRIRTSRWVRWTGKCPPDRAQASIARVSASFGSRGRNAMPPDLSSWRWEGKTSRRSGVAWHGIVATARPYATACSWQEGDDVFRPSRGMPLRIARRMLATAIHPVRLSWLQSRARAVHVCERGG